MKTTLWKKEKKVVIFIGGDPGRGTAPLITLEIDSPQILFDSEPGTSIVIVEGK